MGQSAISVDEMGIDETGKDKIGSYQTIYICTIMDLCTIEFKWIFTNWKVY